jgi:F0F1-type ATP synthase assembly protein I
MLKKLFNISDKHAGSMIAIILGILLILSNISLVAQGQRADIAGVIGGLSLLLGSIAYRIAKKRKLKSVSPSVIRFIPEVTFIVLSMLVVILQSNLAFQLMMNPFTNGFIPLSVLIAYIFLLLQE